MVRYEKEKHHPASLMAHPVMYQSAEQIKSPAIKRDAVCLVSFKYTVAHLHLA